MILSENYKMIIFTSTSRYNFNIAIISSAKKSRTAAVILVNSIHGFIQKFKKQVDLLVTNKTSVLFYSEIHALNPLNVSVAFRGFYMRETLEFNGLTLDWDVFIVKFLQENFSAIASTKESTISLNKFCLLLGTFLNFFPKHQIVIILSNTVNKTRKYYFVSRFVFIFLPLLRYRF